MFVIVLRFADKSNAPALMSGHNEWIRQGIDDGVFALIGSVQPAIGGAILAHGLNRAQVEARVAADPFVAGGVVDPEILEITPAHVDDRLAFLKD